MNIAENIEFDETKLLSEQSKEFQDWYYSNINSQITDKTIPDSLDEYDRPFSFTMKHEGFSVKTIWLYKLDGKSDWGCKDFELTITRN